jgi:hypothetical protein
MPVVEMGNTDCLEALTLSKLGKVDVQLSDKSPGQPPPCNAQRCDESDPKSRYHLPLGRFTLYLTI